MDIVALIAAAIGAAVLNLGSLAGTWGAVVGDVTILLALVAFDSARRSTAQSIAWGAAASFCLLTPVEVSSNRILGATFSDPATPGVIWAVCTLILFAVDRFRMGSRDTVGLSASDLTGSAPISVGPAPAVAYRPAPIRVETPWMETPGRTAEPERRPEPFSEPEPLIPERITQAAAEPTPVTAPLTPPDVTIIPPGREALIYLNLVGEGLNVLRTVRAENLGRDYYRIADVMPEGEQWEFTPGQVVRCRKKSLSNGKHMVAFEEAPRAN